MRRDDSSTNLANSVNEVGAVLMLGALLDQFINPLLPLPQVDNALAAFMSERKRACNAQAEAMKLYDAEMLHINKEVEDEELRNRYASL